MEKKLSFNVFTLFPSYFDSFAKESIIKRAIENQIIEVKTTDFRDYSSNGHKKVDDTPYGGGSGMVLACQPIVDALKANPGFTIMVSPQGKKLDHMLALKLSKFNKLNIVCGHYEGFDERIREYVDLEVSIGDYVLTGGEPAAQVIIDATSRLVPGVIKSDSHVKDSFANGLLEHPQYTKPREFDGKVVPEVLLSGNHARINKWRHEMSLIRTASRRPDLLKDVDLNDDDIKILEENGYEI